MRMRKSGRKCNGDNGDMERQEGGWQLRWYGTVGCPSSPPSQDVKAMKSVTALTFKRVSGFGVGPNGTCAPTTRTTHVTGAEG